MAPAACVSNMKDREREGVGREGSLELSEGAHPEVHILSGVLISLQHLKIGRYHTEI